MSRIKVPFPYMGSKGRFYKEIKEIFAENNLKKLIEKNFKNAEFSEKIYKFQTFGKVTDRIEWFCLIK